MPHLELLLPYELHFSFAGAEAAEAQPEETSSKTSQSDGTEVTDSQTSSASGEGAAAASGGDTASSELGPQLVPTPSFKVDDFTGSAHMSYSIAVPPGRGGLAPQLSLSYSSASGNGWIGVGWDLPIGYIQRRGPRKGVPKYDDTKDVFELNLGGSSQELVCTANCPPQGGNLREYRLRIEGTYLKITYNVSENYWQVWDKSGIKMRFGYAGSKIGRVQQPGNGDTYRWYLDRVDDPKTNYMEISYFIDRPGTGITDGNQIYVDKIQYNGQISGNLPHNQEIRFNLVPDRFDPNPVFRPDPIYDYRGGFKILTKRRLTSIEVKTNGSLVRKYEFAYTQNPLSNPRSLLISITQKGSDGSSALPATTFTYQTNAMGFEGTLENPSMFWSNPSAWDDIRGNLVRNSSGQGYGDFTDVFDMNADGLPDRVVFDRFTSGWPPEYKTWQIFFNNGAGFDAGTDWSNPSAWGVIEGNYIRNTSTAGNGMYTDVIDMDGDGRPDRVVSNFNCTPPYPRNCPWTVYWNTGTINGFSDQTQPNWDNFSAWAAQDGNWIRSNCNYGTYVYGTKTEVIDMNGDGLPDRVVFDKDAPYDTWSVYFNTGSGFEMNPHTWNNPTPWEQWRGNCIRTSSGVGWGTSADLIDMNGDGLPDRVAFNQNCASPFDNCPWSVYFNTGSGFETEAVIWPNKSAWGNIEGNYIRNTSPRGVFTDVIDMNGDGLPDRVVFNHENCQAGNCPWKVYLNTGSGFAEQPISWANPSAWDDQNGNFIRNNYFNSIYTYGVKADVVDIDGDGLPDRVVYNKNCRSPYNNCPWSVYRNKGPVPDLLSKVTNGIGGETEITYAPSTDYQNTFLPIVVQTVKTYTQKDGRGNSYLYKYDYSGGFFDSAEVEFRGFQTVTAYQMFDALTYESKTETTHYQDYYKKGKIASQKSYAKLAEGHTKEVVNTWDEPVTPGGGKFPYIQTAITTIIDQGPGGPFSYSQTTRNVYDLQTFNLLEEHKNEGSPEEIVTVLEYMADDANHIYSKITKATVTNGSGIIASRKWMDYNDYGELTTEELCKSDTPNTGCSSRNPGQNVIISYQYDPTFKVLNQITDPRGYITTITYDSTKTFVYQTTKCIDLGCTKTYTTTTEYDPGTGNLTKSIPAHLQGTPYWLQTQYDVFGRKKLERMKDNADPNIPPIVDRGSTSYTYNDTRDANTQYVLKTGRIVVENAPERTLTLNGYTYYDGMGRTYCAKTNGPDGRWIAVETVFDNLGRVWKQSNPYFVGDPSHSTEFYYDGFSRVTDTVKTDLYQIRTDYEGLRKVVSKQVTATDWQSTAYYYDLNQKLVKVAEGFELLGLETFTEYTYDVLGNLTQVKAAKDASGNNLLGASITTTMTYDSLMKKRSMTDPDMGYWTYAYDKVGNLLTQTDARGKTISFEYNDGLNRLTQKTNLSSNPPERVVYTYDDPTVPNSKGKLTKVSRLVGSNPEVEVTADSVFEYDLMQRAKTSKKKVEASELTFQNVYDSAGRAISITYPGNRTYSYGYDVAGDLLYVNDNSSGINLVEYSDFTALGQHKIANFPKPNNVSVKTTYTYDPATARLRTLMTQKLIGGTPTETYQNLDYQQFDGAGNIKILADVFNNITHNYTYDHLNRLTLANGVGSNAYTQSYQYDRIGNITYKSDVGYYNYTYGTRPHAVNYTYNGLININLQYDANGNMTQRVSGGITLDIAYNYDNKPGLIKKNSVDYVQFTYDGNGQRVKKYNYSTGQSVLYFGDLYEIRGGADTIHIFAGNQRIASVFLNGTTQFYHTNHLGSASVVTDQYGARKEQIEYFPFGTYRAVGNINGTYDFDPNFPDVFYTFTGQEDDDDLGLYNYGARLYDPVLGKFISPDSVVQAPDDPQTLNRYSYARNNPIIYTDPSGNVFIIDDIIEAVVAFLATYIGTTAAYAVVSVAGGAILGAATSAATGGSIWKGALTGAISGAIFFGVGEFVSPAVCGALGATTDLAKAAVTVAVHTVAGAVSGAINSAITGSNMGLGMLTGAVGAGIGAATGGALKLLEINKFGYQLVARTVMGGIAGGIVSQIYGGNFWQGFAQGAATAAAGFLFNECAADKIKNASGTDKVVSPEQKKVINFVENVEKVVEPVPQNTGFFLQLIGFGSRIWGAVYQTGGQLIDGAKLMVTGAQKVQQETIIQKMDRQVNEEP